MTSLGPSPTTFSRFAICQRNPILVYSFSKYFGASSWRFGVVATYQETVLDRQIAALPEAEKVVLHARYSSPMLDPRSLKIIDRLEAYSRNLSLDHTAGLSTPQQVQMLLFTLFASTDKPGVCKPAVKRIIRHRLAALYRGLGLEGPYGPNGTDYYTLFDIKRIATKLHGSAFADWIMAKKEPLEMLFRLAEETGVVLLPREGFGALYRSARASLANLDEYDYLAIGRVTRALADKYVEKYRATLPAPSAAALEQ